jgi:hypothetical protein
MAGVRNGGRGGSPSRTRAEKSGAVPAALARAVMSLAAIMSASGRSVLMLLRS